MDRRPLDGHVEKLRALFLKRGSEHKDKSNRIIASLLEMLCLFMAKIDDETDESRHEQGRRCRCEYADLARRRGRLGGVETL